MKNNQHFDDFIKYKSNQRSFDFDEDQWADMEELLNQEPKGKAFPFWKWGLFSMLVLMLVVGFVWWNGSDDISVQANVEQKISPQKGNISTTLKTPNAQINILNHQSNVEKGINHKHSNDNNSIKSHLNTNSNTPNTLQNTNNTKPLINYSFKGGTPQNLSSEENNFKPNKYLKNKNKPHNINENNKTTPQTSKDKTSKPKPPIAKVEKPMIKINADDVFKLQGIPLANLDDSGDELEELPIYKRQPVYTFGIKGGVALHQGWMNMGEQRVAISPNIFGGIYAERALNPIWSVQVGLNYWQRGALNSHITADSIVYGFGATNYSRSVTIYQLQYLELPIAATYQINEKSWLKAGVATSYLFNAKGTYQQTIISPFSEVREEPIAQNGYQKVFQPIDVALMFGYEHSIWNALNIGFNTQFGIIDNSKNARFKNLTTDRNLQMRVYLSYSF